MAADPDVIADFERWEPVGASFRDPSGFVFVSGGIVYRQVNEVYRREYQRLMDSGLYEAATGSGDLLPHAELQATPAEATAWRFLRPEQIAFISYPYEWCFGQLKAAALLTLRLQRTAMQHGMSLKDATAFNVQFHRGRPVWIDTLSFETLRDGEPWVAYRQFCQFFLAPLAVMSQTDYRLSQLLRAFLDGVPVDLASHLLPWRSWLRPGLAVHVHLHGAVQKRLAERPVKVGSAVRASAQGRIRRLAVLDSLHRTIEHLTWKPSGTVWADYYAATNYTDDSFQHKQELVRQALERVQPRTVWDLGANVGTFSRLASDRGIPTIAFDLDAAAVERNYQTVVANCESNVLPLQLDLTNPSGGMGWANRERMSLTERGPADLALALALVHHLAIGSNVPLDQIARFLAEIARAVVIEFVPKEDSQVQRLLASREDVFEGYTQAAFEDALQRFFHIEFTAPVTGSRRTIYLVTRRTP